MSSEEHDQIDEAVVVLLHDQINTFEKLELVIAIARDPSASWSLDSISAELHIPPADLVPSIDQLRAVGILRRIPGTAYRLVYCPTGELAGSCAALCRVYAAHRNTVTRLLRQIEISRARRSNADAFAEAFQIRRRLPEGSDE